MRIRKKAACVDENCVNVDDVTDEGYFDLASYLPKVLPEKGIGPCFQLTSKVFRDIHIEDVKLMLNLCSPQEEKHPPPGPFPNLSGGHFSKAIS
jgi:hypothetical protein